MTAPFFYRSPAAAGLQAEGGNTKELLAIAKPAERRYGYTSVTVVLEWTVRRALRRRGSLKRI